MTGNNKLVLCHAEMQRAMQVYIDKLFYGDKTPPVVTQVREDKSEMTFTIYLTDGTPKP
jgi:hypothetical protein